MRARGGRGRRVVAPIEELVLALVGGHRGGREPPARPWASIRRRLIGAKGFTRIEALAGRRGCTLHVATRPSGGSRSWPGEVFSGFKALLMEPSVVCLCRTARQHRGHLQEAGRETRHGRRDRSAQGTAQDRQRGHPHAGAGRRPCRGTDRDLSQIDFAKLRDEFASKVQRKHAALQDIRDIVEKKLAADARPQPACGWTTTRSIRRSSPTTTARRTG